MSSKSRLGKGLGALFPALPGESTQPKHDFVHPDRSNVTESQLKDVRKQNASTSIQHGDGDAHESSTPQQTKSIESVLQSTSDVQSADEIAEHGDAAQHVESVVSKASNEVQAKSSDATRPSIPSMRDSVPDLTSPATERKTDATARKESGSKRKRAAMPSLGDMAHPSDMFFGGSEAMDTVSQKIEANGGVAKNSASSTNSVEVSKSDNADESKEPELKPVNGGYLIEVAVDDIVPNAQQPRTVFDEEELSELSASIKEVGVLQPIVVRKYDANGKQPVKQGAETQQIVSRETSPKYELIMGERRWRASQLAGLKTIPAIVKTTSDDEMLRDALLENLHRVALNPLEEAAAYQQMIDEFGLTQAQLSKSISKSRPQIANTLRLLNLPAAVQKKVAAGVLSAGHARALLGLNDESQIDKLATRIIAEGLSVRSTEEIVAMQNAASDVPKKPRAAKNNPWAGSPIVNNLENHFDTKVSIKGSQQHGRIEIVFSSPEDMERILSMLIPTGGEQASQSGARWV